VGTARPLALWAVPRAASTAFERMVIERGDHKVFDEPFSEHYYFGPRKVSARFAEVRPDADPDAILDRLDAAARRGPVFVKDMAYHVAGIASPAFADRFTSTFLIRDPARSLPSLARMWPDFTDEEAGFDALAALVAHAEAVGEEPVVVDSDDLCRDPEGLVAAWCRRVGLPFLPEALSWAPGLRPEWRLWPDWYTATSRSTGFLPPSDDVPALDDERVRAAYERCLPVYEALRARRLLGP
jgi:Sulfotransferase domain